MRLPVDTRIGAILVVLLAVAVESAALSEDNVIDEYGRLKRMALGNGWLDIQSDLRIPSPGWKSYLTLGSAEKPGAALGYGEQTWNSSAASGPMEFDLEQTVHSSERKIVFNIKVTSKRSVNIEGVYFWLDIPEELFAGGAYFAGSRTGILPYESRGQLCSEITDKFMFCDPNAKTCVAATMNRAVLVQINDQRKYNENFSAFIVLHPGILWRGDSTELELTLETLGDADSPAQLTMNADDVRYKFNGFGGNYAFGTDSPVARYTLDNMQVNFARTEMALADWVPEKEKEAERVDWEKLIARDQPGSRLRREFELMQELSKRKIPYATSVWSLPDWMYTQPPKDADATGNKFSEELWPKLLESIGSYLVYAKEKYHAEPEFFSFNEPDIGIKVLFSPVQHRTALQRIGEHFEKLKLKTRMLLGDCANPRGTVTYAYPAAFNAQAMNYVSGISFHSWGGASPKEYSDWADLAARVRLPLYVTEAGVDPSAWRDGKFQTFEYGLREMVHYQKLLLYAKPQAVLFWELTEDYSLLARDAQNHDKLLLTERFCMQKQFADLTPPGSSAVTTSSDQPGIFFTAFRHSQKADDQTGFTLHLANPLWTRKVVIDGAPTSVFKLNAVQTSRGKLFETLAPVEVQDGRIELELPAQSLTTLTTLALPKLVDP